MRLLNVCRLVLEEFNNEGGSLPRYLILSHRWRNAKDEVHYEDMKEGSAQYSQKQMWKNKVAGFCEIAKRSNFNYVWIDTCCIDQSSSREVDYVINRMYRWYQKADACYVYLDDVQQSTTPNWDQPGATIPDWANRGWTLQELLAPARVLFYDRDWVYLGSRRRLAPAISRFTGIQEDALYGRDPRTFSALQIFRWAMHRKTTRPEDMIYSLLGLLDVKMQLHYAEGETVALIRLLEKIGVGIPAGDPLSRHNTAGSISCRSYALEECVRALERQERLPESRADESFPSGLHRVTEHLHGQRRSKDSSSIERRPEIPQARWTGAGLPPTTTRIEREGASSASQSWNRHEFSSDSGHGSEDGKANPVSRPRPESLWPPSPVKMRNPAFERRDGRERDPRDGFWTEVTKDLVVKEAIIEMGYEFEEIDDCYMIYAHLRYLDVAHLYGLSEDIHKARRKRIKEIQWERRVLPPSMEAPQRDTVEQRPARPRGYWDRNEGEESYLEEQVMQRGGFPLPPAPKCRR